jgi:hypothetical protein
MRAFGHPHTEAVETVFLYTCRLNDAFAPPSGSAPRNCTSRHSSLVVEPALSTRQAAETSIVVLNMHTAGSSGLVAKWDKRGMAVVDPCDEADAILARVKRAVPEATRGGLRETQGVSCNPAVPPSAACHADDRHGAGVKHQEDATTGAPAGGQRPSQTDARAGGLCSLFQDSSVIMSTDGSGCLWRCVFRSTQHLVDGACDGCTIAVQMLYLYEYRPAEVLGVHELSTSDSLFAGRLVVCMSAIQEPIRRALFEAGAVAILVARETVWVSRGLVGARSTVQALSEAIQALQEGAHVIEAVFERTICHQGFRLWGPSGEMCP